MEWVWELRSIRVGEIQIVATAVDPERELLPAVCEASFVGHVIPAVRAMPRPLLLRATSRSRRQPEQRKRHSSRAHTPQIRKVLDDLWDTGAALLRALAERALAERKGELYLLVEVENAARRSHAWTGFVERYRHHERVRGA